MSSKAWKAAHSKGRKNRPGIHEISAFLPNDVTALFEDFSKYLARKYGLRCKPPIYTETDGWVYSFGRSSVTLLNHISVEDGAFTVQGLRVNDGIGLQAAMKMADCLYADGFAERFARETALKNEKQKQNTQRRLVRERDELIKLSGVINKAKFNRYRWSAKLSRQKLKKLYENDAKGILDEELLDEIGCTLYARCLQGRDERQLIEAGKIICHHCGMILSGSHDLIQCQCGSQYLFRDYMRSFRKENMPSGAAASIFNAFIEDWAHAQGYGTKMRLVDGLIHEFHVNLNSGVKGRFVGINLIEGTKKQIGDLILGLAYGDNDNTGKFTSNLQRK